ncbi:ATP-NAD kinase family protein [Embleya sp. AB8]|uniref:ATP-NAD kinase family protein n=1 Tax=Embleya sp. AB8 TaxID=3156304 RepID=UPI003C709E6D
MRVGLIVNPVAGLGGAAGLKGSDGVEVQREALARGATARAGERAAVAVRALLAARPDAVVVTVPGAMGEQAARAAGAVPELVAFAPGEPSSAADTRAGVRALAAVDLLLFAGGDGTARAVLDAGPSAPVLGIPAGVKVYSGCFAVGPEAAGHAAAEFAGATGEAEVVDLDEAAYREGRVGPRLHGTLTVPTARVRLSGRKTGSSTAAPETVEGIAREVVAGMRPGVRYLLGPGTTTRAVSRALGAEGTLLGVDVVADGVPLGTDLSERALLDLVAGHETHPIVSVIGGQGFVLGRGNQQISPRVLARTQGLTVLATRTKLAALGGRPLLADTGDPVIDARLSGYVRVITGHRESVPYRIVPVGEEWSG